MNEKDLWDTAARLRNSGGIRFRVTAANAAGAVLVAAESILVGVPANYHGSNFGHDNLVSIAAMLGYLLVAVVVANAFSQRLVDRTFGWVDDRRQPAAHEVAAVIDYASTEAKRIFGWWLGAAVAFLLLNLAFGNGAAWSLRVALGVVLGGLTSTALSFLLLERINRTMFALALAGAPAETERAQLQRRLLFTWALGAAIPVLLLVTAPVGMSASRRADLAEPLAILGVVALAAGLALTIVAARSITEPIDALRDSQRRVGEGDLDINVPVDDLGEIGRLQAGFNHMLAGLRERQLLHDLFGRHVGVEVARQALASGARLGGERREASMLFVDVIGSTSLAQRLQPEDIVVMLNEFFSTVVRTTAAEGGWVNKFEGDAALCVFGPPGDDREHASHALRAARQLRADLSALAHRYVGFDAGIGISTGTVVAGNIGAEDRYEYTVIGDAVNEAARLAELAKRQATRVAASGAAVAAAEDEADHWTSVGSEVLRGRAAPTDLYAPRVGDDPARHNRNGQAQPDRSTVATATEP